GRRPRRHLPADDVAAPADPAPLRRPVEGKGAAAARLLVGDDPRVSVHGRRVLAAERVGAPRTPISPACLHCRERRGRIAGMDRVDVLIAGGGIIGTALAWALAGRGMGQIAVVDLDLGGLYASSELNAGGARATWWQPVNIATCAATLRFFRDHREEFGFRE